MRILKKKLILQAQAVVGVCINLNQENDQENFAFIKYVMLVYSHDDLDTEGTYLVWDSDAVI